jgi:hypothetical protein
MATAVAAIFKIATPQAFARTLPEALQRARFAKGNAFYLLW